MLLFVLALLALGIVSGGVLVAYGKKILKNKAWRPGAAGLSLISLLAGVLMLARAAFGEAALFLALAAGFGAAARTKRGKVAPAKAEPTTPQVPAVMDRAQAAAILGVTKDADAEMVQAAYLRLMRLAHPDVGGTSGLAAQLNAARETLLG
ncbi:MAG: J domain-containing protein [Pseudomonadota bacterium]|jgi:hypothetical protein